MKTIVILAFVVGLIGCGGRPLEPGENGAGSDAAADRTAETGVSCGDPGVSGDGGTDQDADLAQGPEGCADAGATLGTWSCVPSGTAQALYRVWGSGPRDVWAVGAAGTIRHWDGSSWSGTKSGTAKDLFGVWGSGPNDVWAVGAAGTILHWNGCAWSASASDLLLTTAVNDVWGSGPGDVWAVGAEIQHWDGSAWSNLGWAFPGTTAGGSHGTDRNDVFPQILYSVWGSGPNDVWAVGSDCSGTDAGGVISIDCAPDNILHWDGADWSVGPSGTPQTFTDVWGSGPGDVWAVGVGVFIIPPVTVHWDGSVWSAAGTNFGANGIWGSGPDNVWAVGWGDILHWNGSDWSAATSGAALSLFGVWGNGPSDVWAVGYSGTIVHH
jgi:hypothetical protein